MTKELSGRFNDVTVEVFAKSRSAASSAQSPPASFHWLMFQEQILQLCRFLQARIQRWWGPPLYVSDGASVIMGCNSSFQTRLEIVNHNIFVMKCICHSAHLAASFACTRLPCQTEEFIRDVYSYFNHSARHLAALAEFQHFTGTEPHA